MDNYKVKKKTTYCQFSNKNTRQAKDIKSTTKQQLEQHVLEVHLIMYFGMTWKVTFSANLKHTGNATDFTKIHDFFLLYKELVSICETRLIIIRVV